MQIASLPMVEVIRTLMNFGIEFRPDAPGLPSVLVIGGPGSGKDSAARLVALFAKGYTFGSVRTINMAALRPHALVGAMLQGVMITGFTHDAVLPVIKDEEEENPGTVILDELNSLDIDQQGILLRVLENKEVAPLGAPKPKRANFLCVGVMNETPEDLMKEDELRTAAARSNLFGQLLGTVVDEMFRRARRLRPDLYYRMQRYGVIKLPTLHDRRDDIPILFYTNLPSKDTLGRNLRYEVELMAYERLMEKDLLWRGNIRELQAVARRAYRAAEPSAELKDDGAVRIRITRKNVEDVLVEHLATSLAAGA